MNVIHICNIEGLYLLIASLFQVSWVYDIQVSDNSVVYHAPSETVKFDVSLAWARTSPVCLKSFPLEAIIKAEDHSDGGITITVMLGVASDTIQLHRRE